MLRRQLTLEDTPNDLQRGDLLLFPQHNYSYFGVYCGHSVTRKTMNIVFLSARYDHPNQVDRVKKLGIECMSWEETGMLHINDKAFCQIIEPNNLFWTSHQNFIPYSPDLLPSFLRKRYDDICQLLGV